MTSGWVKHPEVPPHKCEMPPEARYGDHDYVGGVWRCYCRKLWIFREGWYFGEIPPWWRRTVPQWHKARWWERVRWQGHGASKKPWSQVDESEYGAGMP